MSRCPCVFTLLWLLIATHAFAQTPPPEATAEADSLLNPFVDQTTYLMLRVDASELRFLSAEKIELEIPQQVRTAYTATAELLQPVLERVRRFANGQAVYVTAALPASEDQPKLFIFRRSVADEDIEELRRTLLPIEDFVLYQQQDFIVFGRQAGASVDAASIPAATLEAFRAAFAAVADAPIQMALVPPEHVRRTMRELSPQLPPQLGGGSSEVLTEGLQWLAMGMDLRTLQTNLVIQSSSPEAARQLARELPSLMRSAYQAFGAASGDLPKPLVESLVAWLQPQQDGSQLRKQWNLSESSPENRAVLATLVAQLGEQATRQAVDTRFRQVLLAMHNFHDVYDRLPPLKKHLDANGRPYLSWRVHLLPFLAHSDLYDKFHLDEPWDSPHNKTLLSEMPDVYAPSPLLALTRPLAAGMTTCQAPVGENTIFGGHEGIRFQQVTDGLSNTVAIVEVSEANAVPWTAPQDYAFDKTNPLAGVHVAANGRWLAGRADGSVAELPSTLPAETVLHLFLFNDGQPIDLEE